MIDPLWPFVSAVFFSLLFATTAWYKWQDMNHTATVVARYHLVPVAWCYTVAYGVASGEVLVVVLLWTLPVWGAVLMIGLLIGYAFAIQINLQRGRVNMDCGCGGVPIRLTPLLVVRNLLLVICASLLLVTSTLRMLTWVDVVIGALVAVTLLILYYAGEQLLSNRGRHLVDG